MKKNLTYKNIVKSACLMVGLIFSGLCSATLITADISNGAQPSYYEFQYNITNDTTDAIDGITLYFDYGLFQNISLVNIPANWDFFADDPFSLGGFEESGIVDGFAISAPLAMGQELTSLVVSFEWLGSTDIASYAQSYEIYDAATFNYVGEGSVALSVSQVPEPSTIVIFALAIILLMTTSVKRRQGDCDAN